MNDPGLLRRQAFSYGKLYSTGSLSCKVFSFRKEVIIASDTWMLVIWSAIYSVTDEGYTINRSCSGTSKPSKYSFYIIQHGQEYQLSGLELKGV